jgi:predicted regulator of Ras-like GTPase activity (Roadblock/LC7/MglB family)
LNEEGLRSDVNSLDVLISLAHLYIENGLIDEAKELLKTAIKENKGEVKPYSILGKIYIDQGEKNEAVKILETAIGISPENKEIKKMLKSLKVEEVKGEVEKKAEKKEIKKNEKITKVGLGDSLGQVLEGLLKIKGIVGVLVVDDIGALIEAELELPMEPESTGAIISSIYDKVRFSSEDLKLGAISRVFFELPGGDIIVLGSRSLRFIVLTTKNVLIGGLEGFLTEAFSKTIEILGVE